MARFFVFSWIWFGIVTALITRFSGAPEPFTGWLIASVMIGPPILYLWFKEKDHAPTP